MYMYCNCILWSKYKQTLYLFWLHCAQYTVCTQFTMDMTLSRTHKLYFIFNGTVYKTLDRYAYVQPTFPIRSTVMVLFTGPPLCRTRAVAATGRC